MKSNNHFETLNTYNIKAKKALGQNFLVDENILNQIASSIDISGKNIIEVGPGYGALTEKILEKKPKSLSLVELDKDMINILNSRIENKELDISGVNFEINNSDVLKFEPSFIEYYVIANIPYYITSPILRHFLYDSKFSPEKMLILMQKDVGEKIVSKKTSVLSLIISKKCLAKELIFVSKNCFVPAPKVESSVLLFERYNKFDEIDDNKFLDLIKAGFKEPRKKLLKNLVSSGYKKEKILDFFSENSIGENARGEELSIELWGKLVKQIYF